MKREMMDNDEKKALNRTLYRRLKATFGNVRIRHPGEKQERKLSKDLETGKPKPLIIHPGEYYVVCCPFCNDTRFRCYINHQYGRDDELGRQQMYLATCFNAGCSLSTGDASTYRQLEEMLTGHKLYELRKAMLQEGKSVDLKKVSSTWPGEVTRIDKLPSTHESHVYLAARGFDPEQIGRFYNVHWCTKSDRFICQDRLIIPIYHRKRMVGWQARAAYDCDWKNTYIPKYYTAPGTPRRQILYNFGNAVRYTVGVITEGVTDVWKIGPQAMCTLGATMTLQQQSLFVRGFKHHCGVLVYDPDVLEKATPKAREKMEQIVAGLNSRLKSGFCRVDLPEGTDPGSLTRSFLRPYVAQKAAEQGVLINWNRREPTNG
jgi:hypothetical protein